MSQILIVIIILLICPQFCPYHNGSLLGCVKWVKEMLSLVFADEGTEALRGCQPVWVTWLIHTQARLDLGS